jgi:NitT/TauT family transport system substrate-binding protein
MSMLRPKESVMSYKTILVAALLCPVIFSSVVLPASAADTPTVIKFGTLPVLQALPLFVAEEKGLFAKRGLDVELVTFASAADKDIALSGGAVDGCFADLVTPTVLKANGRDVAVVATGFATTDRRMFAVMVKPGSTITEASKLAGVPVAVSSNSVIHLVTEKLLADAGVPPDKIETLESKNIGLRLQMLLAGQLEAATLPEPLATVAEAKGAKALADDKGLDASQTVLVFSTKFLKEFPEAVKKFVSAVDEAGRLINAEDAAARAVMEKRKLLPEALKDKYPAPKFPQAKTPSKEAVDKVADWLHKKGVTPRKIQYDEVIAGGFIPEA